MTGMAAEDMTDTIEETIDMEEVEEEASIAMTPEIPQEAEDMEETEGETTMATLIMEEQPMVNLLVLHSK